MNQIRTKVSKKQLTSVFMVLFLTVCTETGLYDTQSNNFSVLRFVFSCITNAFLVFVLFFGFDMLSRILSAESENDIYRSSKKTTIMALVLMWTPYLMFFSPGILQWDTQVQINDYFDGYTEYFYTEGGWNVSSLLNAHHPVFDTIIYGEAARLGLCMGNPNIGIFALAIIQILLLTYALYRIIDTLCMHGMTKRGRNVLLLFFGLVPFYGIYAVTILKNTTFTIAVLLYVEAYFFVLHYDSVKYGYYRLAIISVLVALTNKTGIFTVVLCALFLFFNFSDKESKKKVIYSTIPTLLICGIILPHVIYPMAGIFPGGKQEVLGAFFMQTARTVVDHGERIPEKDKSVINLNYS